jgi:hypothetical protein
MAGQQPEGGKVRYLTSMAVVALALLGLTLAPAASAAPPAPEIQITAPSSLEAGTSGVVEAFVFNNDDEPLAGPVTITETVSPGTELSEPQFHETANNGSPNVNGEPTEDLRRVTGQLCEKSGLTWTCTLTVELPGIRGGVVLLRGSERQLLTVESGATGNATVTVQVTSGNAPPAEAKKTIRIGAPGPFEFGWRGALRKQDHSPFTAAGSTPDSFVTDLEPTTFSKRFFGLSPTIAGAEQLDDAVAHLPPGLIGNPQAIPTCPFAELQNFLANSPNCPADSQVGLARVSLNGTMLVEGLFNVEAPVGSPARFGFNVDGVPVLLTAHLNTEDYGIDVASLNTNTTLALTDATIEVWGVPAEASHDGVRGLCLATGAARGSTGESCPSSQPRTSFLRSPTRCDGPLDFGLQATTYQHPELVHRESFELAALKACDKIPFGPDLSVQPTSLDAESPTGLHATVQVPNTGLENPDAVSESDIKGVKVALPQGVTLNPSQAEGLGVCTEAQYESSELSFHPDGTKGCPSDSKIGTVSVKTPLLEETIPGDVYVAKPYDNPFDSLLAIYVVLEEPQRGILVKAAGKVDLDPETGQITTTFDDLPQQPFTSFEFKFREGARAPLVTPPTCGSYETEAQFVPWSDPSRTLISKSSFQITRGIGGGPCPPGGIPPFKPGLIAGTLNNNAGSFSPFTLRLHRTDGEQQFTHFSIKLPPGVTGKLAGVPFCPDSAIAAAKAKTGKEELANPSCPAASEVGKTLVGAGVGSVLTYVPGKVYLAGPYNGSALSIMAITSAVAGPFDLGTVVVREALRINPETAEVFIDATGSDPLPHIIKGIPTKLRDIRAYVDKPDFVLNPTSCDPTSTASTVLGSGLDFSSALDDEPVTVSTRFQVANCLNLPFKPKLSFRLKGGTKRGKHPSLRAHLKMNGIGEAAIEKARVTLPRSEFLENAHIGTICTRVQFREGAVPGEKCPAASIYGRVRAVTPILDEPLEGPIFLRSSEHELPDLVAALHSGRINVALVGRIDSVKGGGIRNTFDFVPDAPVTSADFLFGGGSRSLLVNSTNLCRGKHLVKVELDGHNGKISDYKTPLKAKCAKRGKRSGTGR